jgi:16S rRNA (uracil1498-N3)-methyltransferase
LANKTSMRKHRFYVDQDIILNSKIELSDDVSHQISRVLRLRVADVIYLFNNSGAEYTARIENINKKNTTALITARSATELESAFKINLGQVIGKGEKIDWVIQKATELGVHRITPLYSSRSVSQPTPDRAANKSEHWQKIAIAACAQSWRNIVPIINPPQTLNDWIETCTDTYRLILSPSASSLRIRDLNLASSVTVLVGPEGGFSEAEIACAVSNKFAPVSLGPRILRTETAGLAAIAVLQSMFGDL